MWYYEHPLPPHRAELKGQKYSASDALQFDEFKPFLKWWKHRKPSERAWRVEVNDLRQDGYNLTRVHPDRSLATIEPPSEIASRLQRREADLRDYLDRVSGFVGRRRPDR